MSDEKKTEYSKDKKRKEKREKAERIQQLKLEAEATAGYIFLEYQDRKIKQLQTINEMLKQEEI